MSKPVDDILHFTGGMNARQAMVDALTPDQDLELMDRIKYLCAQVHEATDDPRFNLLKEVTGDVETILAAEAISNGGLPF